MRVPLLDLKEQLAPLRDEMLAALAEALDSTCYILGPKVEALEKEVAAYCGAKYGIGVSSGTDALLASLMALGVGPGDLVLTTPYTFFATVGSILRLGARPLFADIDPETYNINPAQVEEVLAHDAGRTAKIKVVLPVHLYGQCADMAPILDLAEKYGIPVVEDAAQAIGAAYPFRQAGGVTWRKAGAMGAAGCFSFFPSKNLGGVGDGGMIICNDPDLAERLRIVRVHGGAPKYHHAVVGGNFRLDPLQAAVLSIKLPHLPHWHQARRRNAAGYKKLLVESGLVAEGKVRLPVARYEEIASREETAADYHIYNQYVLRGTDRDNLVRFLHGAGIGAEVYYPIPLHKQQCLVDSGFGELSFPEAEKAARETLALPIYPELSEEMQQYVVEKIRDFYQK